MINFEWPIWHWHIEVSSKCTLKCPLCPRNELPHSLVQDELSLEFFTKNFTSDILDQVKIMTFCGDDGDPIYAKDFLKIIEYIKKTNPTISVRIVTAGSYKKIDWWSKLGNILNEYDEIHWSVDGYNNDTNNIYRVNSNWDSIINGITSCKTSAIKIWDLIYFKFNENHLQQIEDLAKTCGIDKIQYTKSTKFGYFYPHLHNDLNTRLEPNNKNLISTTGRFIRTYQSLTDKKQKNNSSHIDNKRFYQKVKEIYGKNKIIPLCLIGNKGLFINSQGYFIPCCWMANRYSEDYKQFIIPELNIKKQGLYNVLQHEFWSSFFPKLENFHQCNEKCIATKVTEKYATNW